MITEELSSLGRTARTLWAPPAGLRQQVARGVLWLVAGDGATAVLGFVKVAIMARLLSATDFGLFGIALLFSFWCEHLTELGFRDALIQKQGEIQSYLDTAWTAQVLRGLAIAALVIGASPVVAWYYDTPALALGMKLIALDFVLRSLTNPAIVHLRKNLDLRRDVAWRLTGPLAGLLSGIVFALVLQNAFALFYSLLTASLAQTVASYVTYPYRPRFRLARTRARDLLRFGNQLLCLRIVGTINWSIDSTVLSKVAGLTATGHYQMAVRLAGLPGSALGSPLHGIMFPAFSKLADPARQGAVLAQALTMVLAVTLPLALSLAAFSHLIVPTIFGAGWSDVAIIVVILSAYAVTLPTGNLLNAYFMATGRIDLDTRAAIARTAILLVLIYPAVLYWGGVGAAAVAALSSVLTVGYQLVLAARLARLRVTELRSCLNGGVLASIPLFLVWPFVPAELSVSTIAIALVLAATSLAIGGAAAHSVFTRPLSSAGGVE